MSWEKGFVIDKDPTLRKRVNCKDCYYYDKSDKSCGKRGFYHPVDGYAFWKTCPSFDLDPSTPNYYDKVSQIEKMRGKSFTKKKNLWKPSNSTIDQKSSNQDSKSSSKNITVQIKPQNEVKKAIKVSNNSQYKLKYGECVNQLSKSQKKNLENRIIEVQVGNKKRKFTIEFDDSKKVAYLMCDTIKPEFLEQLLTMFKK